MKVIGKLITVTLLSVVLGAGFGLASAVTFNAGYERLAHVPVCTGDVVTVYADERMTCDVVPPQRLDVVMQPTVESIDECLLMGGMPLATEEALTCEDVDY